PGRQWSSPPPAVSPAVLHRFCCRAAVDRPRVPLLVAMVHSGHLIRSGGESELSVGIGACSGAPFKESEQLRSHVAISGPDVETDQPRDRAGPASRVPAGSCCQRASPGGVHPSYRPTVTPPPAFH